MTKYLTTFLLILSSQVFGQYKLDIDCFVMGIIDDGTKKLIKEEKQDWEWIDEFPPPVHSDGKANSLYFQKVGAQARVK